MSTVGLLSAWGLARTTGPEHSLKSQTSKVKMAILWHFVENLEMVH